MDPQKSELNLPYRGFRIAEAARYMGVSPWFVELQIRLFVKTGGKSGLPAVGKFIDGRFRKMCRHYTILKEDMDAFLDTQRVVLNVERAA